MKLRGTPSARLRPRTSISLSSLPGKAVPISCLMRSAVLGLYSAAIAFAATTEKIEVDEPKPEWFMARGDE